MLAMLLVFSFALFENYFYKNTNKNNKTKYFDYFIIFLIAGILFALIGLFYFIYNERPIMEQLYFIYDWRFWLFIIIELIGMFTLNQNYINNPKDHTVINVGIFSTVLLTPLVVYFLDPLLGFEHTLHITIFNKIENIFIFILIYSTITLLYFLPKIKLKNIHNPGMIIVTSIALLMSFYIEVKVLQTYEFNWFIYAIFEIMLALINLFFSIKKEKGMKKKIKIKHVTFGVYYAIAGSAHMIGLTLIATEIGVLTRRVSQILSGYITDKKKHSIKDYILVTLMVIGGIFISFI